jgi:Cytochrome P460
MIGAVNYTKVRFKGSAASAMLINKSLLKESTVKLAPKYVAALGCCMALAIAAASAAEPPANSGEKYALKVPGGLAFSEFRGYEDWSVIAISQNGDKIAVIVGNPIMIDAYRAGIPANGKPFPDGAKMAKIHWYPKKNESEPGGPTVPGNLHDVDFMIKDAKRFTDSGGWGWAVFEYDQTSMTYRAGTTADRPPQEHDAKCGFACHSAVKDHDYVFTDYGSR